jgi:hypothetical protein
MVSGTCALRLVGIVTKRNARTIGVAGAFIDLSPSSRGELWTKCNSTMRQDKLGKD